MNNNHELSEGTSDICSDNDNYLVLPMLLRSSESSGWFVAGEVTVGKSSIETDILEAAAQKPFETRWAEMDDDSDDDYLPKELVTFSNKTGRHAQA